MKKTITCFKVVDSGKTTTLKNTSSRKIVEVIGTTTLSLGEIIRETKLSNGCAFSNLKRLVADGVLSQSHITRTV